MDVLPDTLFIPHKFPHHSVFLSSKVCYHGNISRLVCCISGLSVYASLVLDVLDLKCLSWQYLVYPFWATLYPQFLFNAYKVQKEVKLLVYNCLKLRFTSSDQSGGAHTKHFKMKQQQVTK